MSSWGILFLLSVMMVSFGAGAALVAAPRLLPFPASARFLTGFALAPQLVGFVVLLVFATVPGVTWGVVHFLLFALSIAGIVIGSRPLFSRGRAYLRELYCWSAIPQLAALLAVLLLIMYVVRLLSINGSVPLIAMDALQYAREASLIAEQRDIAAWVGHAGLVDGSFRGDIHHPVFSGYIAWAQRFSDVQGPMQDQAMRWAYQITFLWMLAALPVAGLAMRWGFWSLAVLPLVLVVPQMDYISASSSRDAFRIIPVVLTFALLLRLGVTVTGRCSISRSLPALVALSMFSLTAHTLNGFVLVCVMLGWLSWALLGGGGWNILRVGAACAFGALFGCWTYLDAWFATGNIHGQGVLIYSVLDGTPMMDLIRQLDLAQAKGLVAPSDRIHEILNRDGRGLALVGLNTAWVVLLLSLFRFRRAIRGAAVGTALITLFLTLPVIGAFDVAGYEVSQWFVTNSRYALHWYVVLATALLAASVEVLGRGWFGRTVQAVAVVLLCYWSYDATLSHWYRNHWSQDYIETQLRPMFVAANMQPKRLVLEDSRWNYYLSNKHVVMYSSPTRPLFTSQSDSELDAAMARLNAWGFVLQTGSLESWWSHSPLAGYLARRFCRIDFADSKQTLFLLRTQLPVADCAEVSATVIHPKLNP